MKNIKTIIKILITVLIAIVLVSILPKVEDAINYSSFGDRNDTWQISGVGIGNTYTFDGLDMFKNKNVFCMEYGEPIAGSETYTTTRKIVFDGSEITVTTSDGDTKYTRNDYIEFAKKMSYILAYNCSNQNRVSWGNTGYVPGNDPKQLALWELLYNYSSEDDWKFLRFTRLL